MADTRPDRKLTPKQEKFCQHYIIHWNATRAAKEAGYSEKTAMEQGYQLTQISSVQNRIKELSSHAVQEMGITKERVLKEYSRIAFVDQARAYDEIGQLLPIKEMPEDVRRAISKIRIFENFMGSGEERQLIGFTKEVEFASKKGALDSLAKYLGMMPDKIQHSGPNEGPIETLNKYANKPIEEIDARIKELQSKQDAK